MKPMGAVLLAGILSQVTANAAERAALEPPGMDFETLNAKTQLVNRARRARPTIYEMASETRAERAAPQALRVVS
jgi:hypothetical protein